MVDGDHEVQNMAFFPRHLIPHMSHPLVAGADVPVLRYLEAQHLFQWLQFTARFEVAVVNRATERIAGGTSGVEVPMSGRLAAYKIYVDEGYHSLYSLDLVNQVSGQAGLEPLPYDFAPFLERLDAVADALPGHRRLMQLLQVVVFETLITSILRDIPADKRVMSVVRDTVKDHAEDEGQHHAYFSRFFGLLWSGLDEATRDRVAVHLPALITRSLRPATEPATNAMLVAGFPTAHIRTIVEESYSATAVNASNRVAAEHTIRLFEAFDVLDRPGVREQFTHAGLIE